MKFNEKLVLNSYLLSLFGVDNFEVLANEAKNVLFQKDMNYVAKMFDRILN